MAELEEALQKITIYDLFVHFGYPLPEDARRGSPFVAHSPFRKDEHPSFSVYEYNGSSFFADKSPAHSCKGNALTFFRIASGNADKKESARAFCRLAGTLTPGAPVYSPRATTTRTPRRNAKPSPQIQLALPTAVDLARLSQQRAGLSPTALAEASRRGQLRIGHFGGYRSWFVTDRTSKVIQARRLDCSAPTPYPISKFNYPKAMNVRGSRPEWPLGFEEAMDYPNVVVCEGGPDFLAAFHFLERDGQLAHTQPITFLGGENGFTAKQAAALRTKNVMVFPHNDTPGTVTLMRWRAVLCAAGVRNLKVMNFSRIKTVSHIDAPVKDLNDLVAHQGLVRPGKLFAFFLPSHKAVSLPPGSVSRLSSVVNGSRPSRLQSPVVLGRD